MIYVSQLLHPYFAEILHCEFNDRVKCHYSRSSPCGWIIARVGKNKRHLEGGHA